MRAIPYLTFGVLPFGITGVLAYIIWQSTSALDELGAWLIAINVIAFLLYVYDKAIAGSGVTRVPEMILLALVLFGGGLGAGVAMVLRRHKTSKPEFLALYGLCLIGSLLLRDVYYRSIQPLLATWDSDRSPETCSLRFG